MKWTKARRQAYMRKYNKSRREIKRVWMWNKRHPDEQKPMPEGNSKWKALGE